MAVLVQEQSGTIVVKPILPIFRRRVEFDRMDFLGPIIGHRHEPTGIVMCGSMLHMFGLRYGPVRVVEVDPNGRSFEQGTDGGWHCGQTLGDIVVEIREDPAAVDEDRRLAFDNDATAKFDGKVDQCCIVDSLWWWWTKITF